MLITLDQRKNKKEVYSASTEKQLHATNASFLLGVCFRKKKDVGADILVAGTVIINSKDYAETIKKLR